MKIQSLTKIRNFALLLDEDKIRRWDKLALEGVLKNKELHLNLIIISSDGDLSRNLSRILRMVVRRTVVREVILPQIILFFERFFGLEPYYSQKIKIKKIDFLKGCPVVSCQSIQTGKYGIEIPEEIITKIKNEKIDLIVNRKKKILKGKILTSVPYGVISFHSGDIRKHRGARGFLKCYCNGETYMTATLQRLSEEVDGGVVISEKHIDVRNCRSYKEFNDRVYFSMSKMLAEGINHLNTGRKFLPPKELGKIYLKPNLAIFLSDLSRFIKVETLNRLRLIK